MVAPVEPPPHLWDNIKNAIGILWINQLSRFQDPSPVRERGFPVSRPCPTSSRIREYPVPHQPEATSSVSATPTGDADKPVAATIAIGSGCSKGRVTSIKPPDRAPETRSSDAKVCPDRSIEQPSNVVALSRSA